MESLGNQEWWNTDKGKLSLLWNCVCVCVVTDVDASSDDEKPVVTVDTWLTQAEVKMTFECQEVTSNGYTYPR